MCEQVSTGLNEEFIYLGKKQGKNERNHIRLHHAILNINMICCPIKDVNFKHGHYEKVHALSISKFLYLMVRS